MNGDDGPCHDVVQFNCFLLYFERFVLVCHIVFLPVSSCFPPSWLSWSVPHYTSAYLVQCVCSLSLLSVRQCSFFVFRPRSCLEFPALYSICAGFCFVFPLFVLFPSACQLFIKTRSLFHHLLARGLHFFFFFLLQLNSPRATPTRVTKPWHNNSLISQSQWRSRSNNTTTTTTAMVISARSF